MDFRLFAGFAYTRGFSIRGAEEREREKKWCAMWKLRARWTGAEGVETNGNALRLENRDSVTKLGTAAEARGFAKARGALPAALCSGRAIYPIELLPFLLLRLVLGLIPGASL